MKFVTIIGFNSMWRFWQLPYWLLIALLALLSIPVEQVSCAVKTKTNAVTGPELVEPVEWYEQCGILV